GGDLRVGQQLLDLLMTRERLLEERPHVRVPFADRSKCARSTDPGSNGTRSTGSHGLTSAGLPAAHAGHRRRRPPCPRPPPPSCACPSCTSSGSAPSGRWCR